MKYIYFYGSDENEKTHIFMGRTGENTESCPNMIFKDIIKSNYFKLFHKFDN